MAAPRHQFKLLEKLRRNRRTHQRRRKITRGMIVAAGFMVTFAGVAMLVLPGPAFVVIPVGLYLLALEFDWAERWLASALKHAHQAGNNSFTTGLGRFIKQRPRLTAALLALLLTLIGALIASLFALDVLGDR